MTIYGGAGKKTDKIPAGTGEQMLSRGDRERLEGRDFSAYLEHFAWQSKADMALQIIELAKAGNTKAIEAFLDAVQGRERENEMPVDDKRFEEIILRLADDIRKRRI